MKLCRYQGDRLGWVEDGSVRDVTCVLESLPAWRWPLPAADPLWAGLDALRAPLAAAAARAEPLPIRLATLLAPVPRPGKIVATRGNCRPATASQPDVFLKAPSSVAGPGEGITLRHPDRYSECEIEVAAVIGLGAARVSVTRALEHVAGYCLALDLAIAGDEDRGLRKSPDSYCVLGPWVTTADEIQDPGRLTMDLRISGAIRQSGRSSSQPFSVAHIVSYVSRFLTLQPGDVILMGATSAAVKVRDGDTLDCSSEFLGQMRVAVASANPAQIDESRADSPQSGSHTAGNSADAVACD